MKKEHKFFEIFLDNDLDELHSYLILKRDEILNEQLFKLSDKEKKYFTYMNGPSTQLAHKYNIFDFDNDQIKNLKNALKTTMMEACKYYEINYDNSIYIIHGWFNVDYEKDGDHAVSPLSKMDNFHDHMDGVGAPVFHGYYCVNAEPSSTFYKINNDILFENINKNNRAIVSETGHPHGRDDWYDKKERITVAYDIAPVYFLDKSLNLPNNWCYL